MKYQKLLLVFSAIILISSNETTSGSSSSSSSPSYTYGILGRWPSSPKWIGNYFKQT